MSLENERVSLSVLKEKGGGGGLVLVSLRFMYTYIKTFF